MFVLEAKKLEKKFFFEIWRKNFDLFVKTALYVPRGTHWVKKIFESSIFFQILKNFEWTFTVLGEKLCGRDIKIELCTLCLQSIILRKKIIFWKFCKFLFNSDVEHKNFGFVATEFSSGYSKVHSRCLYEFSSRCWY